MGPGGQFDGGEHAGGKRFERTQAGTEPTDAFYIWWGEMDEVENLRIFAKVFGVQEKSNLYHSAKEWIFGTKRDK